MISTLRALSIVAVIALSVSAAAVSEAAELRVAKQYGLGYLQMMVMEDMKLVEKHTKAAGLGDVKVSWSTFRSSDVMNDALLSGNLDFASLGRMAWRPSGQNEGHPGRGEGRGGLQLPAVSAGDARAQR